MLVRKSVSNAQNRPFWRSSEARLALQLVLAQVSNIVNRVQITAMSQYYMMPYETVFEHTHTHTHTHARTHTRYLSAPCQSHRAPGLQGTWGWARGSQLEVAYRELSLLSTTQAASCRDGLLGRHIVWRGRGGGTWMGGRGGGKVRGRGGGGRLLGERGVGGGVCPTCP